MLVGQIKSGNCHEFLARPILTDLQKAFCCLVEVTLCISLSLSSLCRKWPTVSYHSELMIADRLE